jgi:hypothetical protein
MHGDNLLVNYLSHVTYVLQMSSLVTGELLHDIPIDIGLQQHRIMGLGMEILVALTGGLGMGDGAGAEPSQSGAAVAP